MNSSVTRGVSPATTPEDSEARARLQRLALRAAAELDAAPAHEIMTWAAETFGPRLCVTSSMTDAVLVHLAASVSAGIDVVFLDTGYHFPETIGTRDAAAAMYQVNITNVTPARTVAEQDAELGPRLYGRNPDLCCYLRKVVPLERALAPYEAWVTGVRREEAASRSDTRTVEWDDRRGMVKVNPIAAWTGEQVDAYIAEHGVLINPLVADGYPSVGCSPCTMRAAAGSGPRSGRWAGTSKTECGLHT